VAGFSTYAFFFGFFFSFLIDVPLPIAHLPCAAAPGSPRA
jgi:hypothetical protein